MKYYLTILLILICNNIVYGNNSVDSIVNTCRNANVHDTDMAKCVDLKAFEISGMDPRMGLLLSKRTLSISKANKWTKGIALANNEMAVCYNVLGNFDSALLHYQIALDNFKKLGNIKAQSAVLTNISQVYKSKGNYLKALNILEQALKIQNDAKMMLSKGITIENIGIIYMEIDKKSLSKKYLLDAKDIYEKLNDSQSIIRNLVNLGITYDKSGEFDSAIFYFEQALKYNLRKERTRSIQTIYSNLGNAYFHKSELDKAIEIHTKSIQYSKKLKSESSLAIDYGNIGEAYLERHKKTGFATDLNKSISYLKDGFFLCQKIGYIPPQIEFGEKLLEALDIENKDFKLAYTVHRIKTNILDSIMSTDSKLKINELISKNAIEHKENELRISKIENSFNKSENKKIKLQKTVLILVVVIFGLFIILLYLIYINKERLFRRKLKEISQFQAHQIRSPVTKIMSIVYTIRKNPNDEKELLKLLDMLEKSTEELDTRMHEIFEKYLKK